MIDTVNVTRWMTQGEASAALGVRPQTLYAYASRGRIRVCSDPGRPRRRLYAAEDVATLLRRRAVGRSGDGIAASTMSWGEPIIATQISTILRGRLYYRGRDAIHLAADATLEQVAMLLWDGEAAPVFPTLPTTVTHPPAAGPCLCLAGDRCGRGIAGAYAVGCLPAAGCSGDGRATGLGPR
ncbi:MAG: helix-turn-helix domain-containing protein [Janthinobacterium lividum]